MVAVAQNESGLSAPSSMTYARPGPSTFKTQMGVSISRFRNQQRLQRFLHHDGNGRRTTALDAAHEAGFGSYARFYRVFRQETGRRPTGLRLVAADELQTPPRS